MSDSDYVNNYIKPHILIETGGRAAFDPYISQQISPFALDEIMEHLKVKEDCCVLVDVLDIERTFYEKLTLIHELNHRGIEALTNRQTRHIYDLIQIYKSHSNVVTNLSLLEKVRKHKEKYFRRAAAKWDLAIPGSLFILPFEDVQVFLRDDWNKMTDMFPGGQLPYTFDEMMLVLKKIDGLINQ